MGIKGKMTYGFSCDSINFSYYSGVFGSYSPRYSYANPFLFSFTSGSSYGPCRYYGPSETSYSRESLPKLSLSKNSYAPAETSYTPQKATSFSVLTSQRSGLGTQREEASLFRERTVTPRGGGKYKRPSSFKSNEAARLWNSFSSKASAFNPKTDLGPDFLAKVKKIAKEINCEYKDLLSLMQVESGLNPYMPNLAGYGAYGLIQFQPATLRGLGYQPEDLLTMSPVKQLDIVKKHLLSAKKSRGLNGKLSAGQLYGLVLAPGYVNNSYFYSRGCSGYSANAALDTKYGNNNGKIEKSDLAACIHSNRVNENIFA